MPPSSSAEARSATNALLLTVSRLTKDYSGFRALNEVDFELRGGEVHVLFGENGAGKSTLISILAGARRPTAGEIAFRGQAVSFDSVHEARELGISAVFQEFSLVPQMTVEENLFLGDELTRRGFLRKKALRQGARELLARLGFAIDAGEKVENLTRAERQMVEIAKAFRTDPAVLILDEPTASLTDAEADALFNLVADLKQRGVGIIYITHRMNEIRRVGDRITVLRDGRYVDTVDAQSTSEDDLVRLMTGRVISEVFPQIAFCPGDDALVVESLSVAGGSVREVSLHVQGGEVVGLAGLIGSGKSEVARGCFGAEKVVGGRVILNGEEVTGRSPREMLQRGFYYIPPDRREEGLVMMRSCRENITLSALGSERFSSYGLLRRGAEFSEAKTLAERFCLTPMRIERPVELFSGGNQQKVMLAKCLTQQVKVFVFDEPTVGVDVGTRAEIYHFIRELCENGAAVLLISSDLPEVLHLSRRLYVFYRGQVRAELEGDDISEETVLSHFFEKEAA